jgi:hypothetical protein
MHLFRQRRSSSKWCESRLRANRDELAAIPALAEANHVEPRPAFGPTDVRTNITDNSVPSNSGWRLSRLAGTNSAAARSAPIRSSAIPINSLRWMRSRPLFQLGSHCAVMLASADSSSPIKANATMVSINVNPRSDIRRVFMAGIIPLASASGARYGHRIARRPEI